MVKAPVSGAVAVLKLNLDNFSISKHCANHLNCYKIKQKASVKYPSKVRHLGIFRVTWQDKIGVCDKGIERKNSADLKSVLVLNILLVQKKKVLFVFVIFVDFLQTMQRRTKIKEKAQYLLKGATQ